jgi:hypothetical protein
MSRSHALSTGWLVVLCTAGLACTKLPPQSTEQGGTRVDRILEQKEDKDALTGFTGRPPSICVVSTGTTELCEWRLGNRYAGWAPLAAAIETGDQVNLICKLPSDGSPRAGGSCSVHPRRSNRGQFRIPNPSSARKRRPKEHTAAVRARYRKETNEALAQARTLPELARLIGAVPNECSPQSSGLQVCLWLATNRTYGHGTLAMSIGAPKRKRVQMRCQLPTDGSERAPNSCRVEVGG